MNLERWAELMNDLSSELTDEELKEGWHFCVEWDGLLIGPCSHELHCCQCLPNDHPVYNTVKDLCVICREPLKNTKEDICNRCNKMDGFEYLENRF